MSKVKMPKLKLTTPKQESEPKQETTEQVKSSVDETIDSVVSAAQTVEVVEENVNEEESSFFDKNINNEDINLEFIQKCFTYLLQKMNVENKKNKNLRTIIKETKQLKKFVEILSKKKKIKKTINVNHKKAGLEQPKKIIPEFIEFYKNTSSITEDVTELSRIDITKFLCNYIKEKNLQNPENRTKILPDESLIRLLKLTPEDIANLKYSTLQKPIKNLFVE